MEIKLVASGSRPWHLWTGRWGLSYVIDDSILFDTFCNYALLKRKLDKAKVDARGLQSVVISHDHWDHTGGLEGFLREYPNRKVYLPSGVANKTRKKVIGTGGDLIFGSAPLRLKDRVFLSDAMVGDFEGQSIAEQFIAIDSPRGWIVVVGCSHPGIIQMVQHAKTLLNGPVYGVIGGLHLFCSNRFDVMSCAESLKQEGVQLVAPTHCTGWRAERVFLKIFGAGFVSLGEGKSFSL